MCMRSHYMNAKRMASAGNLEWSVELCGYFVPHCVYKKWMRIVAR